MARVTQKSFKFCAAQQYEMTLRTTIALKRTCKVSHTLLYQQICVTFSVLQAWIGGIQKFLSRWCRAKSWRQKTGRFGETIRSSWCLQQKLLLHCHPTKVSEFGLDPEIGSDRKFVSSFGIRKMKNEEKDLLLLERKGWSGTKMVSQNGPET